MDPMNMQPENQAVNPGAEVGKLFRSAMRGFNKQDVTEYIDRMARDRRRDAERYGAHIRSLEEERTSTSQELESLRNQVAELVKSSYASNEEKENAQKELETLRGEQETFAAELEDLRREKTALEEKNRELTDRLEKKPETQAPVQDCSGELEAVRQALQEREEELARVRRELDSAKLENSRLQQELESVRNRASSQGSAAALISRVRPHTAQPQNGDSAAMQVRIDRARQCVQEGISECNVLYNEMHRNIERLEEILRNLND